MDKLYFSKALDLSSWKDKDTDYMTLFLVPRRWWSIKDWRFANDLIHVANQRLAETLNTKQSRHTEDKG